MALVSLFEAEFGVAPAPAILARNFAELHPDPIAIRLAQGLVSAVMTHRDSLDARLVTLAPRHPVTTLGRIDRVLLRCALAERAYTGGGEPRALTAAWTAIARDYGGDASRLLMAGVLGALAKAAASPARPTKG